MEKVFLVMELSMGCCFIESSPHKYFKNKDEADKCAKDGNESEYAKSFIEAYRWDDVEYKFFVMEIELL